MYSPQVNYQLLVDNQPMYEGEPDPLAYAAEWCQRSWANLTAYVTSNATRVADLFISSSPFFLAAMILPGEVTVALVVSAVAFRALAPQTHGWILPLSLNGLGFASAFECVGHAIGFLATGHSAFFTAMLADATIASCQFFLGRVTST